MRKFILAAASAVLFALPAAAQQPPPPKLLVVISVDQFSAKLFDEYRPQFTADWRGWLRDGVRQGYQSHAGPRPAPAIRPS